MKPIAAVSVLVAAALLVSGGADAKPKKRTYCQKAVTANKGKVNKKVNGVTVYHSGRSISACSDKYRKDLGLTIIDAGAKVAMIKVSAARCLVIVTTKPGDTTDVLSKDLAGKEIGSTVTQVGFIDPLTAHAIATVDSIAVAPNCTVAWGESVGDDPAALTRQIRAKGFGRATSVTGPVVVSPVTGPDDTKHVAISAHGRSVTVTWTLGGVRQSKLLGDPPG